MATYVLFTVHTDDTDTDDEDDDDTLIFYSIDSSIEVSDVGRGNLAIIQLLALKHCGFFLRSTY